MPTTEQRIIIYAFMVAISVDLIFFFIFFLKSPISMYNGMAFSAYTKCIQGWTVLAYNDKCHFEEVANEFTYKKSEHEGLKKNRIVRKKLPSTKIDIQQMDTPKNLNIKKEQN